MLLLVSGKKKSGAGAACKRERVLWTRPEGEARVGAMSMEKTHAKKHKHAAEGLICAFHAMLKLF